MFAVTGITGQVGGAIGKMLLRQTEGFELSYETPVKVLYGQSKGAR